MKVGHWLKFEEPHEKAKLKELVDAGESRIATASNIAKSFNMELSDACKAYDVYKERIKKGGNDE